MQERIDAIGDIAGKIATQKICTPGTLLNATTATGIESYEALIMNYDPHDYADIAWNNAQEVSRQVVALNGEFSYAEKLGASTEAAVHNLIWYGIATHGPGRYVRPVTYREDSSGSAGRRDGCDLLYRTEKRRWKIQTKSHGRPEEIINKYVNNVIVISPQILTMDRYASANDIHEAITNLDTAQLDYMWHNFLQQLRTQKAPNAGIRRVI